MGAKLEQFGARKISRWHVETVRYSAAVEGQDDLIAVKFSDHAGKVNLVTKYVIVDKSIAAFQPMSHSTNVSFP